MARLAVALLLVATAAAEGLGVNWGTQASHPLPPKAVVQLRDNGIMKVKLFQTSFDAMSALAGSGVEVMVAIPNNMLHDMAGNPGAARNWVKRNVKHFDFDGGVIIKYVAVGNEPFLESYNGSFIKITLPALQNIQNTLNDAGVGDRIKATVSLNADVYNSPAKNPVPSAGRFRADISGVMTDIVKFLAKNKAPFTVNIYPFLSLYLNDNFPLDFAFFDGGSVPPVNDNGVMYTNVFDANFDTLVAALRAVGHGDMPIIVGEVGWPTDGDRHAKASYAQRFYDGLLRRLAASRGTPARPGRHMEVYLFGLVDEDQKSVAPGSFERHWGILRYDGQPKYAMDLAGQGRDTTLVPAKGVRYLSRTWCALNPKARDLGNLGAKIDYACSNADCTPLGYGSTCNGMDAGGNASYAFNAYYQAQSQKDETCDFQGLALPTETDPSTAACNFTIQIDTSAAVVPGPPFAVPVAASVVALVQLLVMWVVVLGIAAVVVYWLGRSMCPLLICCILFTI